MGTARDGCVAAQRHISDLWASFFFASENGQSGWTNFRVAAGLLPLLWADGAGAEIMKRVGAPMLGGGLATSAFLTLEVLPVLYAVWRQRQLRRAQTSGCSIEAVVRRIAGVGANLTRGALRAEAASRTAAAASRARRRRAQTDPMAHRPARAALRWSRSPDRTFAGPMGTSLRTLARRSV
jgi:AcrB/AcrD/AcrF family